MSVASNAGIDVSLEDHLPAADCFRLALFTCARQGNIQSMRRADIDLENALGGSTDRAIKRVNAQSETQELAPIPHWRAYHFVTPERLPERHTRT